MNLQQSYVALEQLPDQTGPKIGWNWRDFSTETRFRFNNLLNENDPFDDGSTFSESNLENHATVHPTGFNDVPAENLYPYICQYRKLSIFRWDFEL